VQQEEEPARKERSRSAALTSPHVTLLRDEKRQKEVGIAIFEKQNKILKTGLGGLETAQKTNTKTTIFTPMIKNLEIQRQASIRKVRLFAVAPADCWDCAKPEEGGTG
jgi:hypothetical protein